MKEAIEHYQKKYPDWPTLEGMPDTLKLQQYQHWETMEGIRRGMLHHLKSQDTHETDDEPS